MPILIYVAVLVMLKHHYPRINHIVQLEQKLEEFGAWIAAFLSTMPLGGHELRGGLVGRLN